MRINRRLLAQTAPHEGVELMYLFGSAARGDMHGASDVDVAVRTTQPLSLARRARIASMVRRTLSVDGRDVDLVDLRHASPELAMQIVQDGKRLVGTDLKDDAFFRFAIKRFIDAKKLRDADKAYVKKYAAV